MEALVGYVLYFVEDDVELVLVYYAGFVQEYEELYRGGVVENIYNGRMGSGTHV